MPCQPTIQQLTAHPHLNVKDLALHTCRLHLMHEIELQASLQPIIGTGLKEKRCEGRQA